MLIIKSLIGSRAGCTYIIIVAATYVYDGNFLIIIDNLHFNYKGVPRRKFKNKKKLLT